MKELVRIANPKGEGYLWLAREDFDPAVHEHFAGLQVVVPAGNYLTVAELVNAQNAAIAKARPVAPVLKRQKAEDTTPGAIATVNAAQAIELVEAASLEQLDELEAAERDSQKNPGGRKGVLKAIEERREKLKEGAGE